MRRYCLTAPVPWDKVLRSLRYDLERNLLRRELYGGEGYLDDIQSSYTLYTAVRRFLGYGSTTAVQTKALAILEASPDNP